MVFCHLCGLKGDEVWEQGCERLPCCKLCKFFRQNRTVKDYVAHARKIYRNQQTPRTVPYANFVVDMQKFNRRRDSMRRRTAKIGCTSTMTQRDLYTFVKQNPCHYCGDPATGIDRLARGICYEKRHLRDPNLMVAACTMCNASKRHYAKKTYLDKMKRVALHA